MTQHALGQVTIDRVLEVEGPELDPLTFFPDCTEAILARHMGWLAPRFYDPVAKKLILAIQSYLVRTPHHTILIDTCIGEHKERKFSEAWHMRRDSAYLANLADAGCAPEDIDFVMCTHLHPDHVGWNTLLIDGRWVPTFPNAQYVFSRDEWSFWHEKSAKDPRKYDDGAYADSVLPVDEAGQSLVVDRDHALDDTVWLEPSPGHTPGHTSVRLSSGGRDAVMSGDLMHCILQCTYPDWSSFVCFDKDQARATRRAFLDRYCESGALVMPAHFPSPSLGYIERAGDAFGFRYVE